MRDDRGARLSEESVCPDGYIVLLNHNHSNAYRTPALYIVSPRCVEDICPRKEEEKGRRARRGPTSKSGNELYTGEFP